MEQVWVMKNGDEVLIKDMTTAHLENTIKMLEKSHAVKIEARTFLLSTGGSVTSEDLYPFESVEEMFPKIIDLRMELSRR